MFRISLCSSNSCLAPKSDRSPVWSTKSISFRAFIALTASTVSSYHLCVSLITIKEISDIPFVFMRGVKTDDEDIDGFDMMRGEETELMGIKKKKYGECIYVLPGSHSKIIKTIGIRSIF